MLNDASWNNNILCSCSFFLCNLVLKWIGPCYPVRHEATRYRIIWPAPCSCSEKWGQQGPGVGPSWPAQPSSHMAARRLRRVRTSHNSFLVVRYVLCNFDRCGWLIAWLGPLRCFWRTFWYGLCRRSLARKEIQMMLCVVSFVCLVNALWWFLSGFVLFNKYCALFRKPIVSKICSLGHMMMWENK